MVLTPERQSVYDFAPGDADPKFWQFHADNPEVYEELRGLAIQLHRAGRMQYGIMALLNVVRWQRALQTTDPEYKINNNFAPFYARLLMARESDLRGFFELRHAKADDDEELQCAS